MLGSLLVFIGVLALSWDYLIRIKDQIYSDMKIAIMDTLNSDLDTQVVNAPVADNITGDSSEEYYEIDYSQYLGVLEIPKIGLKRGFYGVGSRYNNIERNVTMVEGSDLPDVPNGNLMLMAHSGDAYISYFAFLYKVGVGDPVYVTYNGVKYQYEVVNIYEVPKNGIVKILRNYERTSLTLVTCTKNNDSSQTVYIAEQVG